MLESVSSGTVAHRPATISVGGNIDSTMISVFFAACGCFNASSDASKCLMTSAAVCHELRSVSLTCSSSFRNFLRSRSSLNSCVSLAKTPRIVCTPSGCILSTSFVSESLIAVILPVFGVFVLLMAFSSRFDYANKYRYSASGVSKYSGQFSCKNARISGTSYAQPAAANGTPRFFAIS